MARHFNHRFHALLKAILRCPDYLGEVEDFFWRVEFQVRPRPTDSGFAQSAEWNAE